MLLKLFFLLVTIPVVEVYLLVKVGSFIGAIPTLLILVLISISGAWLLRKQGFVVLGRIQSELSQGRLPAGDLLDGAIIFIGGVLLITPGFFTDLLGFIALLPLTRSYIKRFLGFWMQNWLSRKQFIIRNP